MTNIHRIYVVGEEGVPTSRQGRRNRRSNDKTAITYCITALHCGDRQWLLQTNCLPNNIDTVPQGWTNPIVCHCLGTTALQSLLLLPANWSCGGTKRGKRSESVTKLLCEKLRKTRTRSKGNNIFLMGKSFVTTKNRCTESWACTRTCNRFGTYRTNYVWYP